MSLEIPSGAFRIVRESPRWYRYVNFFLDYAFHIIVMLAETLEGGLVKLLLR